MKKKLSLILIVFFCLYVSNIQLLAFQSEGQKLLLEGKGKFNKGLFDEAVDLLNKSLNFDLNKEEKIQAYLYLGVCWVALNAVDNAERYFKEIIKTDPEFIFAKEGFPPEIKNIFDKTRFKFPLIYEFSIAPDYFSPYAGESAYFNFKITSPDCVSFSIKDNSRSIIEDRKCFETSGLQIYFWAWKDEMLKMNEVNILLTPERSKSEYTLEKKIKFDVKMPRALLFKDSIFQLEGRKFLPETEIKRSYPNLIPWSAGGILFGALAYVYFTHKPGQDSYANEKEITKSEAITYGVVSCAISLFSLIRAFTPKRRQATNKYNVDENNKLRKEIQNLKEKIKVKQTVLENR